MALNAYPPEERTRWLINAGRGFCIGLADLLPAISGGTIAYLLGFYASFLRALSSLVPSLPWRHWLAGVHWHFLIPFAAGWFIAALFLVRVLDLPELIRNESALLYGLFFGLIAGNLVVFFRRFPYRRPSAFVFFLVGCLIGAWFLMQRPESVPSVWPVHLAAGFLTGGIMLLPGISGSYFLLLIGLYDDALLAVAHLQFPVLIPLSVGAVLGISVFAKGLSHLLKNEAVIYPLVNGLLLVSVVQLWPFRHVGDNTFRLPLWGLPADWSLLLALGAGFVAVLLCPADRIGR